MSYHKGLNLKVGSNYFHKKTAAEFARISRQPEVKLAGQRPSGMISIKLAKGAWK